MTRQGVLFAIGYPPRSQTPRLESERWTYWSSRFNRFAVEFNDSGRVKAVRN